MERPQVPESPMSERPLPSPGEIAAVAPPESRPVDFDAAYRDHFRYVWGTLQRLGVRYDDLEDLAHDVFVIACRREASYDPSLPLRPWLFGIAFRVAAAQRRRARHSAEIATDHLEVADAGGRADETSARCQLVLRALAELNLDQRAVLLMHDLDGYTAAEIGRALDVPLNTVYSRLRLARARFALEARRQLDDVERIR